MISAASFSIKQRHMFIISVVLAGFLLVGIVVQLSNLKVQSLNDTRLDLETLKQSLLTLRRHEKDFLSRKDPKYSEQFTTEYKKAISTTERLSLALADILPENNQMPSVKSYISQYGNTFYGIVEQQHIIGFDHNSGLYGSLRNSIRSLENFLKDYPLLINQLLKLRRHEKDFMLRRDTKYISHFKDDIEQMHKLAANINGNIGSKLGRYKKDFFRLYEAELTIGLSHEEGMRGEMRESAHTLETLFAKEATTLEHAINDKTRQLKILFAALLLLFVVGTCIMVYYISTSISSCLDKLINHVHSLISDDAAKENHSDTNNELIILEEAFDGLHSNLATAINEIKHSAEKISGVTTEIVDATQTASHSYSEQHDMIEQSATAMEEMGTSIQDVAKNASSTSNFVSNINDRLSDATSISATAQEAIESLKSELTNSVSAIGKLQDTSTSIDALLDSIEAIADQTNLLALNAAIESARAGEYGRGFSVVADEVRTLSSKTSAATDEVRKTMDEFKGVIECVVETVKSSNSKGTDGQNHANNAIQMMREMTQKVAEVSMMNIQIATAVEEQSAAAGCLNESIHNIYQSSLLVREANEHTNQATERLKEVVDDINKSASVFAL